MARFRELLSSFSAGEISPRLRGRTDVAEFRQGCEEMTNMWCFPQGGSARRPGTVFCSDDFTVNVTSARVIPFSVSRKESYVIIFTTDKVSYTCGVRVWDVTKKKFLSVYDATAHPTPTPYVEDVGMSKWSGFSSSSQLQGIHYESFGNAILFAQSDNPPFALDFATAAAKEEVFIFPFWAYKQLGVRDITTGDPVISDKFLYMDAWPYQSIGSIPSTVIISVSVSAVSGTNVTMTSDQPLFVSSMVGSVIRVTGDTSATTGVAVIRAVTDSMTATVDILRSFQDTDPTSYWAFSSWGDVWGWPKTVCAFENRVYYGHTKSDPSGFWASLTGDISFMRQDKFIDETPLTQTNADAWSGRIPGGSANSINWITAGRTLFIGTTGREFIGRGPDSSLSMGPLNFNFYSETAYGSSEVQPIRRDSVSIFVQRSGKMIREVTFNLEEDTYVAPQIMKLAEHMVRKTMDDDPNGLYGNSEIVEMAHQESDNQITWFRDSRGGFFGMSRDREVDSQPTGFHYHYLAGSSISTKWAKVLSLCVVPSKDGGHDDVYFMVMREWDGALKVSLEKMGRGYDLKSVVNPLSTDIDWKPVYVDMAAMSVEGSPTTVHGGFDHLEDSPYPIQVIADGHYVGFKTVNSNGEIVLDEPAEEVIAGLYYRSQLIPVQVNMGSVLGASQHGKKTIDNVFINFICTIGGKLGLMRDDVIDESNLYDIEFRDPNAQMDAPIDIFSGTKELTPPLGWGGKMNVVIRQDLPFPQHVSSMVYSGITND